MSPRLPRARALSFKLSRQAAASALFMLGASALAPAHAAGAGPTLSFNSYAQVYGYLNTQYTSVLLGGDVQFTVRGGADYKYNNIGTGTNTTGIASVDYLVASEQQGVGDPIYNAITNNGQYSFGYKGQAEVSSLRLRTQIESTTLDSLNSGAAVDNTLNTYQYSYSQAGWNQGFYIAANATHKAGNYGAILVGIRLDGGFPALADASVYNNASAYLQAESSFTDTAGVSYRSNFGTSASANDGSWTGQSVVFKKLLFQYGTVFNFNFYQYVNSGNNGSADFFNTGNINYLELPKDAELTVGAGSDLVALFGNGTVKNSATLDDPNTNWDFGNNGGGFTPNVPEPQTWAMLLAGLLGLGLRASRHRAG